MEPFAIKQATFLTSVGLGTPYPPAVDTGVEIAWWANPTWGNPA